MKLLFVSMIVGLFFSVQLIAQNTLSLQVEQAKTKINKEIYGQFSEHLGTCIYEGIYVGKDSKIPNIDGFRTDVVTAFKELKVPVLRWPGGCFADTYHWKDGIGPKESRPSIVNVFWGGVTEDNSFGTHEFLNFCELTGIEPYLSINVGSGSIKEASEWVEYVNSSNKNPMSDLRKKNGREKPWNVKFFGIGNETWGCGGDMRPEYYADVYRQFSSYVRGNDLQKIAVGPSSNDYNWTEKMMQGLQDKKNLVQGLSLHHYTLPSGDWNKPKGSSTDFNEEVYFKTLKGSMFVEELIQKHLAIMDKYDPEKKISLVVDEWGNWYDPLPGSNPGFLQQQNTVRDAVTAAINLNIFNNHADRISMANIAQVVNVLQAMILTKGELMVKTPTYYVFKLFNVHQEAMLIPMELKCEDYEFNGEKLPAVSSSASIKDGVTSITLCNLNPNKAVAVECNIAGADYKTANGKIVNSAKLTDYNDFGQPEKVSIKDFSVNKPKNGKLTVELPAHSVVLVQLQ
jgi:alpha-L-arabinofuranosidase